MDAETYDTLFYEEPEEIAEYVPEEVELEDLEWEEVDNQDDWKDYLFSSGKQVLLGNYTEDVTVLGTTAQVGMAFFGIDALADVRDITADVAALWNGTFNGWQLTFDVIAIIPIVGMFKVTDEAALLYKSGDKIYMATKHADEVSTVGKNLDNILSSLKNTDNFASGKLKHIFSGEINKSGKAVGFHYEGLNGVDGKVLQITKQPNKYGVYEASVEIDGITKINNSTFFLKNWTPQQVVDAINEAFSNKIAKTNFLYEGVTKGGMKIQMYIENGKITSAFPIY